MFKQASRAARYPRRQIRRLLLPRRELDRDSSKRRECMEASFPGANKIRPGGLEVISCRSCGIDRSSPANQIPQKNTAFANPADRIPPQNTRLASGKPPPIQRPFYPRSNATENGRTVTTTHMFRPNQRRGAVSLLPISLRNFDFPPCKTASGGGGGWTAATRAKASIQNRGRNF
jgi:hypothetical protein